MLTLIRRLVYVLRQRGAATDLADEMEFHRQLIQQRLERSGMWFESVWQDVMYAFRSLRREAGFTLVALVALGGIDPIAALRCE